MVSIPFPEEAVFPEMRFLILYTLLVSPPWPFCLKQRLKCSRSISWSSGWQNSNKSFPVIVPVRAAIEALKRPFDIKEDDDVDVEVVERAFGDVEWGTISACNILNDVGSTFVVKSSILLEVVFGVAAAEGNPGLIISFLIKFCFWAGSGVGIVCGSNGCCW